MSNQLTSSSLLPANENNPVIPFSDIELAKIEEYCQSLDLANSTQILEYGTEVQRNLSALSERMLVMLNNKSMDDINTLLNTTIGYLQSTEEKYRFTFLKKKKEQSLREKYRNAERNVDKMIPSLQQHQVNLMKNCALLSQMHHMNEVYSRELRMKIAAAKKKLEICKQTELPLLERRVRDTGLAQDAQALANHKNRIDQLEKKIQELELTASISLQSAPLIHTIQSNQTTMAGKLQSTLLNTIPLWKNQVALALGMELANQMENKEQQANEMMNKLLSQNKETARLASISAMQEASRSFSEVATLEAANQQLIDSLNAMTNS